MTAKELRALGEGAATVIDVGKHTGKREIRGAIRYRPDDLLTAERLTLPLANDKPVVLYDEHGDDARTQEIAKKLRARGFQVDVLEGGFAAWTTDDGPVQEASMEQVVPPARADEVQELDRRILVRSPWSSEGARQGSASSGTAASFGESRGSPRSGQAIPMRGLRHETAPSSEASYGTLFL